MISKILRFLLKYSVILLIASFLGDLDLISSGFADSDDERQENQAKKWKGKERAVFSEESEDYTQKGANSEEDLDKANLNKKSQEAFDFELAKRLQDEEYELSNDRPHQSNSSSEYTVYSSEIRDSDSERVKKAKLAVKEAEKSLKLPESHDTGQSSENK